MMNKKILTLMLTAMLAVTVTACKNQNTQEPDANATTPAAATAADATDSEAETTAKDAASQAETTAKDAASQTETTAKDAASQSEMAGFFDKPDKTQNHDSAVERPSEPIDENDVEDLDALEPVPPSEELPEETNGDPVYDEDGNEVL